MEPDAKQKEHRVGTLRPQISAEEDRHRTRSQHRAKKQTVAAERRAIKKAARQQLGCQLRDEIEEEL